MAKLKSTFRYKVQEAEKLKDLAYELTVKNKNKEQISEADIVHWILERELDKVTIEKWEESQK